MRIPNGMILVGILLMVSAMCNSAQEMISLDGYWCTVKERFVMRMERIADDRIRQVWINRAGELRELRFMFRMEATQLFLVHASGWESKYVFEGPQSFRLVRRGRGAERRPEDGPQRE